MNASTMAPMTHVRAVMVGGPAAGCIVTLRTNRHDAPPEWHEMIVVPEMSIWDDPAPEVPFARHVYRREPEPIGADPDADWSWAYRYHPPRPS